MLPVSVEEFAAFLDGNLSQEDTERMELLIDSNKMLKGIYDINSSAEETFLTINENEETIPDEIENMSFDIPDWDNSEVIDDFLIDSDINQSLVNSINIETEQVSSNEIEPGSENATKNDNLNLEKDMANPIQTGHSNFGETGQNIKDPIFICQPDDHSCALRSQQIVLRDFGIDIPFKDLEQIAKENGVYSDNGTSMYDVGKVLDIAGVDMHQVIGSNMFDLTNELAQGHRVIVGVDADELWHNDTLTDKLKNWFHDITGPQGGNHALIVAGVEVNPEDPKDINVVLTDPGSGDLRIEYPMDQFMNAWKDTNCFMAATDNPAPYQYDSNTHMEIPSNFVIEHQFNQFITENSYQLSPDMINIPEDYQPVFSEHLDMIGNETYDEFKESYDDFVNQRNLFTAVKGESDYTDGPDGTDESEATDDTDIDDEPDGIDDPDDPYEDKDHDGGYGGSYGSDEDGYGEEVAQEY